MTFYESIMCVLLEIKICSYKGPNTFHATQQEISNKNSSFFDISSAVEELNDYEFVRTEKMDESISLFLDEMKNSCNDDYTEKNIFKNLPHIIDLDGHHLRKTAHVMMSYIQDIMMNL
jgi:hypothetical protein